MRRAWRTKSAGEHLARAAAAGGLPRVLGLAELTFLGLGSIVGAGVFVLSGVTANSVAGPGVVLSYLVAAAAAALAGLCYAEYAADLPVAGGGETHAADSIPPIPNHNPNPSSAPRRRPPTRPTRPAVQPTTSCR
jgi:amino acid permease